MPAEPGVLTVEAGGAQARAAAWHPPAGSTPSSPLTWSGRARWSGSGAFGLAVSRAERAAGSRAHVLSPRGGSQQRPLRLLRVALGPLAGALARSRWKATAAACLVMLGAGSLALKRCLLRNLLQIKGSSVSIVGGKPWPAHVYLPVLFRRTKLH